MAPRAHDLVLRAVPADAASSPATGCSTSASPICSTPIMSPRARAMRGRSAACSRGPTPREVGAYRAHVDPAVAQLLARGRRQTLARIAPILEIGLQPRAAAPGADPDRHPARAVAQSDCAGLRAGLARAARQRRRAARVAALRTGIHRIGHDGRGFCLRQRDARAIDVLLRPSRIAARWSPTANGWSSWRTAATATPALWLSDGWATVQAEGWQAPGYWQQDGGRRVAVSSTWAACGRSIRTRRCAMSAFTRPTPSPAGPARDLPTEAEWEVAARAGLLDDARRHRLAMDPQRLSALSRLPAGARARSANTTASSWSTRWCCAARRWRRRGPCAAELSQLLPPAGALAVRRPAAGVLCLTPPDPIRGPSPLRMSSMRKRRNRGRGQRVMQEPAGSRMQRPADRRVGRNRARRKSVQDNRRNDEDPYDTNGIGADRASYGTR